MRSQLHIRLKEGTREAHESLEQGLDLTSSLAAYVHYLQCMLAFHGPLERSLQDSALFQAFLPDAAERVRMPALRADLAALDADTSPHSTPELPAVRTLPQVVGVSYVLEGSTLGGQVIARMLQHAFNLSDRALHYVHGYGDDTGKRFKTFLDRLGRLSFNAEETDAAVASAHETFTRLRRELTAKSPAALGSAIAPELPIVH